MKIKTSILGLILSIAATAHVHAQYLVQNLAVSLHGFNPQTGKQLVITTRDVIRYFIGTNVNGGVLQLVTPEGNEPGTVGNLNAFLRISRRGETLMEVFSPNQFNLFQDTTSLTGKGQHFVSRAINRFSIDFAYLHAELQGFSTWNINANTSGSGSFVSSVNGWATVDGITQFAPVRGTITAGAPKHSS